MPSPVAWVGRGLRRQHANTWLESERCHSGLQDVDTYLLSIRNTQMEGDNCMESSYWSVITWKGSCSTPCVLPLYSWRSHWDHWPNCGIPVVTEQSDTAMHPQHPHVLWWGLLFLGEFIRLRADYIHVVILLKCIISSIFFLSAGVMSGGGERVAISTETMLSLVIQPSPTHISGAQAGSLEEQHFLLKIAP